MEGRLEERVELREAEVPDGLSRAIPFHLILDGMVEAEEIRDVLAGAVTNDGVARRVTLPLAEVDAHLKMGRVEIDVAVPCH